MRPLTRRSILAALAGLLTPFRSTTGQVCQSRPLPASPLLKGFQEAEECYAVGLKHKVFRIGKGPAVFLCHELPGLYEDDIELARRIAARGFSVWLPLFFGSPGDHDFLRFAVSLCLNPRSEFTCWLPRTSPAAHWVEPLLNTAHSSCGGKGVGVIGMCLTGSFALAAMSSPALCAAILCQPTQPFLGKSKLDLSPGDLDSAKASTVEILALKFSADPKSPDARWRTLRNIFQSRLTELVIDSSSGNHARVSHGAHSVLGDSYNDQPGTPTREAFERVIRFLDNRLSEVPSTPEFPRIGETCPPGFAVYGTATCPA